MTRIIVHNIPGYQLIFWIIGHVATWCQPAAIATSPHTTVKDTENNKDILTSPKSVVNEVTYLTDPNTLNIDKLNVKQNIFIQASSELI